MSKPTTLNSVTAIRRYAQDQKAALERDVWACASWEKFLEMRGRFEAVIRLMNELGIDGAEDD